MASLGLVFWEATAAGAMRAGTPLLFAAVGELIYERSGILNLAIEGMMLSGAFSAAAAQVAWDNWMLSLLTALVAGAAFGFIHAFICTVLRANQVATGLALMTLAEGLTALLGRDLVGKRIVASLPSSIPVLDRMPILGRVVFSHDILVYLAVLCALLTWVVLYRTRAGVQLRAIGEDARTAMMRGLPVIGTRLACGTAAGALCALGGAHLSLVYASQWQEGMTAGRGWIALVLVMFSLWRPRILILSAYLFGGLSALQLNLQAAGVSISSYLLGMLPFVGSLAVFVLASAWLHGKPLGMPADLGQPYQPIE